MAFRIFMRNIPVKQECSIPDLKLIEAQLPRRVIALVLEWAFEHRVELVENWQRALAQVPLRSISPLE